MSIFRYRSLGANQTLLNGLVSGATVLNVLDSFPHTYVDIALSDDANKPDLDEVMQTDFGYEFVQYEPSLLPENVALRSVTYTAVGGEDAFYLPVDNFFYASSSGECSVFIDGASLLFGVDFQYKTFGAAVNPGPNVSDVGIGVKLSVPTSPGQIVLLRWLERTVAFTPSTISAMRAVFVSGEWIMDPATGVWNPSSATNMPNGILVAGLPPPYVIELWRLTRNRGGVLPKRKRSGQRFVPYFRAPYRANGVFSRDEFAFGNYSHWRRFKACVYNPATGARGPLTPQTIVATLSDQGKGQPDRRGGNAHPGAGIPCRYGVWIMP